MSQVSESVARPVRGVGQGITGGLIVDCLDEFTRWEPTTRQYGLAVIIAGAIVSFIQNTGENRGWWKAVLRTVPPTKAEVVDQVDVEQPEQTDNRVRDEDGKQMPPRLSGIEQEWYGEEMR